MYYVLKKGKLRDLTSKAFRKAGNIYILEKKLKIPKSTLSAYHMEKRLIKLENLQKLEKYLGTKILRKEILDELPINWRQIKGGRVGVEIRKQKGTFAQQLKLCNQGSSQYMKNWHKKMKKENPEEYYKSQFDKFRKVGLYKFKTKNGEEVRNSLERDVANVLNRFKLNYEYEPFVKIGNKGFFPDFVINNKIIVECTMWRHSDKAIKLKDKIKYLKKEYDVYVVVPKALNRYYKILNQYLVLGSDAFVSVAQTFRDVKSVRKGAFGRAHGC